VRFLYYFRRKLNLGEHRGHCLATALRLISQEQARDIQNYVILCLSSGILVVSLLQQYQVKSKSPGILRRVDWYIVTDVSEKRIASILMLQVSALHSSETSVFTIRHGVISQETWTCIIAAMGTSSRNTR